MALEDESSLVRTCALETLAETCTDRGRALLVGLREEVGHEEADAFVEAAGRCPSADLFVGLGTTGVHGRRELFEHPAPNSWEEVLDWIASALQHPPPNAQALALLEQARREVDREQIERIRAEIARGRLERAESALRAGRLDEAEKAALAALDVGASAQESLRQVHLRRMEAASAILAHARSAEDVDRLLGAVGDRFDDWLLLHPEAVGVSQGLRYERDLALGKELVQLAREGREEAANRRLAQIPASTLVLPFEDLAKTQQALAISLLEQGAFDRAWREAWLVRTGTLVEPDRFISAYAAAKWESERWSMDGAEVQRFVEQVGDHAPEEARTRVHQFELEERLRGGDPAAGRLLLASLLERLVRGAGMCFGETTGMVIEALENKELDEVAGLLEYAAQNVTTDTGRRVLRAKRDRGRALAQSKERLLRDSQQLRERIFQCVDGVTKMEARRGARRGSEAHAELMRGARETLACADSAAVSLQRIERRGEECLRFIRESGELIRKEWNR